jgi:hypothetical protein
MPKALIPLTLPPGVYRNGTPLQAKPRWRDSNLVRWRENALEPQGGWRRRQKDDPTGNLDLYVEGAARSAFIWRDNLGIANLAIGTHSGLYVFPNAIDKENITPTGYTAGSPDSSVMDGYGEGDYGEGDYGMPAELNLANAMITPATMWTLDNFGQELIAQANSDGILYRWSPIGGFGLATPIVATTGTVPVNNASFVVTNERILMALGADANPRLIRWSDQENTTVWLSTPLNQAGDILLQTNGEIITARKIPDGVLIWTSEDLHIARYLGFPFVYGFSPLAGKMSLASTQAIAVIDSRVVWMGDAGFWLYDGYLQPLASDVGDDLFEHINRPQISKVWALVNHGLNEVVWFYPSDDSNEIDRYVTWNYHDNYWIRGTINRTSGVPAGILPTPVLISAMDEFGKSYLYNHNTGYDYEGQTPFVESWPIELGQGEKMMFADQLLPDELQLGDVRVSFHVKHYPTGDAFAYGPYDLKNPTNIRVVGRQMAVRFEGARPVLWRIGNMRLQAKPLGRRPLYSG